MTHLLEANVRPEPNWNLASTLKESLRSNILWNQTGNNTFFFVLKFTRLKINLVFFHFNLCLNKYWQSYIQINTNMQYIHIIVPYRAICSHLSSSNTCSIWFSPRWLRCDNKTNKKMLARAHTHTCSFAHVGYNTPTIWSCPLAR